MPTCQLLFFPLYSLWEQIDAGVSPGLQNQCGALTSSRMGSIPICSRQKDNFW